MFLPICILQSRIKSVYSFAAFKQFLKSLRMAQALFGHHQIQPSVSAVNTGHSYTPSEAFGSFNSALIQITIDQNAKTNWECQNCQTENKGGLKNCGFCNALHPKYVIKPKDAYKQSMVKKHRTRLLSSKEIFKKFNNHFPNWHKYKDIQSTTPRNKRRLSKKLKSKPKKKNSADLEYYNYQFNMNALNDNMDNNPNDNDVNQNNDFENVLNTINWTDPFGFNVNDKIERPTIISDEDDSDPPLYGDNDGMGYFSFSGLDNSFNTDSSGTDNNNVYGGYGGYGGYTALNMNSIGINGLPKTLQPRKHHRQQSISAPSSPPSQSIKQQFVLRVDRKKKPLLIGVIHCPAPSKKNRLDIVMKNIENIVKFEYDGIFFINHGFSAHHLVSVIKDVHQKYPSMWIGANFMGIEEKKIFKFVKTHKLHKILKGPFIIYII